MHLAADVVTDHLADFHIRFAHSDVVLVIIALTIHVLPVPAVQHQCLLPVARPAGQVHDIYPVLVALIEDPFVLVAVGDGRRSDGSGVVHISSVGGLYGAVVEVPVGVEVI